MYYLREVGAKAKNGRKKTYYKNNNYDKVKAEFIKLCEECNHTRSYYISSSVDV